MRDKIDRLFKEQIESWPMLERGINALRNVQTRDVRVNGYRVSLRHLPHRIASTTAVVDSAAVARRPCFLCASNLPREEKGLEFNADYTIYCNPFPILDRHLTIVHREHRPQRIAGQLENMIAIAKALPECFVIYNGPQCGASAPDHMHFQACAAAGVPIVGDVKRVKDGVIPNYARQAWVFRDFDQLATLIGDRDPEPLLNLAMFYDDADLVAVLFPRRKHRPDVFYTGEFTVSPATIDLCGVFVTPVEKDFVHLSGSDVRRIYEEVSLTALRA